MASFADLEKESYYLMQIEVGTELELLYVALVTEKAVLMEFENGTGQVKWYRKTDPIFDLVEKFSAEMADQYDRYQVVKDSEQIEPDWLTEGDEEEDDFWEDIDEEEEDDDDNPLRN
jgi:hypothetical protein